MKPYKRLVASMLIASTTLLSMPIVAHAGIVPTEEIISSQANTANRQSINVFLQRADVRSALQEQGINGDAALSRVAVMSDSEVAQLAGRIDKAPAGGEVLGIIFTVFIVLLVTDILGLTKVFPFTRSVR